MDYNGHTNVQYHEFHMTYTHIVDYRIPLMHTCWMLCPTMTRIICFFTYKAWSQDVAMYLFHLFTLGTSHKFSKNLFVQHLVHVHLYSYILRKYFNTHKYRGLLGDTTQDSSCDIPSKKYQKIFLGEFPAQIFPLFRYIYYFKWKIINHQWAPNSFLDNLITFTSILNSNYPYHR